MDTSLLKIIVTTDNGLQINDEVSILQDESIVKSSNENVKYMHNKEKQLQEISESGAPMRDTEILPQENICENGREKDDRSEKSQKRFFDIEKDTNKSLKDELFSELENQETNLDSVKSKNCNFSKKRNDLVSCNSVVSSNKSEKLINNTIDKNSMDNSQTDIPLEAGKEKLKEKIPYDEDTVCGLGMFKPRWLQPYATINIYLILYSTMGILQGSYYSYMIGSLSTLEKKFSFKSKTSGVILSADEITPVLIGVFIGYYASKAHRPRIVALGILLSAGCCFCSTLPYFIYGTTQTLISNEIKNLTGPQYCDVGVETTFCDPDKPQNLLAVLLFIFGSFLKGLGNLAYYAVGLAYMDDNSDKKSTPIYLAIALALRLLGPLVGFLMSSGFLKFYENPAYDPGFGPDDPRWVGAWWIGFFLQGVLLVIFTIPIALFPRRLPGQNKVQKTGSMDFEDGLKEICTGLISALKRLGRNPVFIVLIINSTMTIFGHFGHAIMLPKYMENQFRLSASEASLYSGAITIVCIIISTLLGGFLIWKFRPTTKLILAGMITSEIIMCIGYLVLIIPRCQTSEMLHFGMNEEGLILNSVCNKNCDCSTSSFTPFCGPDGKTLYFSPCYAGCTEQVTSSMFSKMSKEYSNCSCVDQQKVGMTISEGFCPDENCRSQMLAYLIILFFMVTIANLFTVASTMILLRSVHPSDKSTALGTFETFICLFGFIPFPVTFGALVDSACLVWEKSCGETGNCWFYDIEKYSYLLHGASALFCFLSAVCLITLYCLSSRIRNLYIEEDEGDETKDVGVKLDTVSGSVTKL